MAIGPANYAGQATAWARAVAAHLPAEAWSFAAATPGAGFSFEVDKEIRPVSFRNPVLRGLRSRALFSRTTHVALDGFKTYFRAFQRGRLAGDARWLAERGWRVALISHGTDTRSPERHMGRLEWSYFRDGTADWRDAVSANAAANRETAEDLGLPVFYSTPDLALDLPGGTWLPVAVDVARWASAAPVLERPVPRVVHVPSNSVVKGTRHIEAVCAALAERGVIEYIAPGRLPHAEMAGLVSSADVLIDQVVSGYYGVAAVEAMAAGRVVIGSLAPDVRDLMPEPPPYLAADPSTLLDTLTAVLDDRPAAQRRAAAGPAFALRWHDGAESARRLAPFLEVSP
ncbi:MAG: hypothetical protein QM713_10645 [Arachnia sp.]